MAAVSSGYHDRAARLVRRWRPSLKVHGEEPGSVEEAEHLSDRRAPDFGASQPRAITIRLR